MKKSQRQVDEAGLNDACISIRNDTCIRDTAGRAGNSIAAPESSAAPRSTKAGIASRKVGGAANSSPARQNLCRKLLGTERSRIRHDATKVLCPHSRVELAIPFFHESSRIA